MNINLHARNIDTMFRAALYAMGEFAMFKLVPSKRLRNNITLNIHLKHHSEEYKTGELALEHIQEEIRDLMEEKGLQFPS